MKIRFKGYSAEVQIVSCGVVVRRGEVAEVPDDIAKDLLRSPEWEAAQEAPAKKEK